MKTYHVATNLIGCSVMVSEKEFNVFIDYLNRHDPAYSVELSCDGEISHKDYFSSDGCYVASILESEDLV